MPEKKPEKTLTKAASIADNLWRQIKDEAFVKRFGSLTIKFTVHDGQIRGAERVAETHKYPMLP